MASAGSDEKSSNFEGGLEVGRGIGVAIEVHVEARWQDKDYFETHDKRRELCMWRCMWEGILGREGRWWKPRFTL